MTIAAPYFDPSTPGQYAAAEPPFLLRNGLTLQPGGPARCRGVDPATLPGVPAQVAADMKNPSNVYFIYRDFNGAPQWERLLGLRGLSAVRSPLSGYFAPER